MMKEIYTPFIFEYYDDLFTTKTWGLSWENIIHLSCLALPCLASPCLALPCLALPCLAVPCRALPCLALPCLGLVSQKLCVLHWHISMMTLKKQQEQLMIKWLGGWFDMLRLSFLSLTLHPLIVPFTTHVTFTIGPRNTGCCTSTKGEDTRDRYTLTE